MDTKSLYNTLKLIRKGVTKMKLTKTQRVEKFLKQQSKNHGLKYNSDMLNINKVKDVINMDCNLDYYQRVALDEAITNKPFKVA
jgi:hypothetical protein